MPTKYPTVNKPWGIGCLAVVKAVAIHRKSRHFPLSFQKTKSPRQKATGSSSNHIGL
jgi:hypothetical protein